MNRPTRITLIGFGIVLALALWKGAAKAYFDTGNALYEVCIKPGQGELLCMGTIIGYYDMLMALGYDCGSETTKTKAQIRDVVLKRLRDHPEDRSGMAATTSYFAIIAAFKCTKPP